MPRPPSLGRVTSPYGWRTHPITSVRTMHYGEDTIGEGNYAPVSGEVIFAGYYGGLGNLVTIREDWTTIWLVGHHASLAVNVGDQVVEGVTFLGPQGATGAATGVHAHTERRLSRMDSPQAGTATNPRDHYTAAAGINATPIGEQKRGPHMATLYNKINTPTVALAGDSPGTPANWLETTDSGLIAELVAVHGPFARLTAESYEAWKASYLAPLAVGGAVAGGSTDPKIAELLTELVAATRALNPPG